MDLQGTRASPRNKQAEHNPPQLVFGDHNSLTSNSPPWLFCAGRIPPAPATSSFVHQLVLQLFTWPCRTKQNRASSLLVVATFLQSSGHTPSRQPQHYAFKIHSSPRASLLEEQSTLERRSDFFPPLPQARAIIAYHKYSPSSARCKQCVLTGYYPPPRQAKKKTS